MIKILKNQTLNSLIALLISVMALLVSVRSCDLAQRAQNLSESEFKQVRQLILKGEFDDNFSIKLVPIDDSFTLLSGNVYFPTEVYPDTAPIDAEGKLWHTGSISLQIEKYLNSITPREKGYVVISDSNFPLVIDSYFAVKGEVYNDRSLYSLRLISQFPEEDYKHPSVSPKSIVFAQRLPFSEVDPREELDKYFNQYVGDSKGPNKSIQPTAKAAAD